MMNLYRTTYTDDERPNLPLSDWSGSQAEASKDRKRLKAEGMRKIETTEEVVPTDKKGLLAWLNKNCA
jgi:hypothetical protein